MLKRANIYSPVANTRSLAPSSTHGMAWFPVHRNTRFSARSWHRPILKCIPNEPLSSEQHQTISCDQHDDHHHPIERTISLLGVRCGANGGHHKQTQHFSFPSKTPFDSAHDYLQYGVTAVVDSAEPRCRELFAVMCTLHAI